MTRGSKNAFVSYATEHGAREAVHSLNGVYRFRHHSQVPVRVEFLRPDGQIPPGPYPHLPAPHLGAHPGPYQHHYHSEPSKQKGCKGKCDEDPEQVPKVFVGQLPTDIKEEEIEVIFRTYGEVKSVIIAEGKGNSSKIGFVEYANLEQCRTAMSSLDDNYKFRKDSDRPIKVNWAKSTPRKNHPKSDGGDEIRPP